MFLRRHQSAQAFLHYFFLMLDLLAYVFPFFSSTWLSPLLSFYLFQHASLASFFLYQLSVRFNLVVGSLLFPLDLCNTPTTTSNNKSKRVLISIQMCPLNPERKLFMQQAMHSHGLKGWGIKQMLKAAIVSRLPSCMLIAQNVGTSSRTHS